MTGPRIVPTSLLLACLAACTPEDSQELAEHAYRSAGAGVDRAREELERAGAEIEAARERYEIDERVAEAQQRLERGLDETASAFDELAKEGAEQVAERVGYQPIEGAAESIHCEALRCEMDSELVERLADQPRQLVREARLMPAKGATGDGLRLSRIREGSIPALLGLRDGDILLAINGASLSSFDAMREVSDALVGGDEAELVFERDGERETLVVVTKW